MNKNHEPILNVRNLNKRFITKHGVHNAVNNVSFKVDKGEIIGLIGQSGSGKSTIANALVRLLKDVNGVVTLDGEIVSGRLSRKREKAFYRNVQMIYQDPHTALNEKRNVFSTIAEPLITHKLIAKEARDFLRLEKDVMTSWGLTLDMTFHKKELEAQEYIAHSRIASLEKILANLKSYEVEQNLSESQADVAFNTLVSLYFEDLILAKNACLTKTIETTDFLLDFYQKSRESVIMRDLPLAELGLVDAQHHLRDYLDSFDDVKIDKKIKLATEESKREMQQQRHETKIILAAFVKDRQANIKSEQTLAQISKTNEEHQKHKFAVEQIAMHKKVLASLVGKNFAVPKELLYEYEAKLADLANGDEINSLTLHYETLFKIKTDEYMVEMGSSLQGAIAKLSQRKGKKTVADPAQVRILETKLATAQVAYDIERKRIMKIYDDFHQKLLDDKRKFDHEKKTSHIFAMGMHAKKEFRHKAHLILAQVENRNFVKSKKVQLEQKFARLKAYDIEERQLLKSLESIRVIYQIRKMWRPVRYFVVKRLLLQRRVMNSLVQVGLKPEHAYRYPHEFSGGQKQRINIARALILEPQLIIADEPIASLDISIQAQVINILIDLVKSKGISMIFIGHDLSVIEYLADSILVMHLGRVVEKGYVKSVFRNPIHPYTKTLFASIPKVSTANEPFQAVNLDLSYIKEYEIDKPTYKIVAPHHLLLANDRQLKKWANQESAATYSTDVYEGQKIGPNVAKIAKKAKIEAISPTKPPLKKDVTSKGAITKKVSKVAIAKANLKGPVAKTTKLSAAKSIKSSSAKKTSAKTKLKPKKSTT